MYYQITIWQIKDNKIEHILNTERESTGNCSYDYIMNLYKKLKSLFKESEGYHMRLVEWQTIGTDLWQDNERLDKEKMPWDD